MAFLQGHNPVAEAFPESQFNAFARASHGQNGAASAVGRHLLECRNGFGPDTCAIECLCQQVRFPGPIGRVLKMLQLASAAWAEVSASRLHSPWTFLQQLQRLTTHASCLFGSQSHAKAVPRQSGRHKDGPPFQSGNTIPTGANCVDPDNDLPPTALSCASTHGSRALSFRPEGV